MTKVLITGGCGFIGSHLVAHILKNTDWHINIIDKLTYASVGFDRLRSLKVFDSERIKLFTLDISNEISDGVARELKDVEYVFHLAAESHVDRSIINPQLFVKSNVLGTVNVLILASKMNKLKAMVYFSTDEVFGPCYDKHGFKEWDRYLSSNQYSASKAGAEEMVIAFANTHNLPVFTTHAINNFGQMQHNEKFIPMTIRNILEDKKVFIHTKNNISGSRFWLHARNSCDAVMFLLDKFKKGDKYNIPCDTEKTNLEIAQLIASIIGKKLNYEFLEYDIDRPGHDFRYALDGSKVKKMGWEAPIDFDTSFLKTVRWYLDNPQWLYVNVD